MVRRKLIVPTVSRVTDMGTIPSAAFQYPVVGLKPTTPVKLAGILHDPAAWQAGAVSESTSKLSNA